MESRTHNHAISPENSAGEAARIDEYVFELVRERLLKAVGAGGMWTLQFRASTDTDSLFGETIAEFIARDIADQIAVPGVEQKAATPNGGEFEAVLEVVADTAVAYTALADTPVAYTALADTPVAYTPVAYTVVADKPVVEVQRNEHRLFRPRKAA
ncbi:hypothetical protein [Frigoribacterium sp. CG_9.8]|uniref:hypothetical protein n=1 Tax=Frigoribacterium sp. CG_9.8 TaxID=2787733 RepID=UPI0018CBEFFC|nr:hypothetical protein [Frigoribacterium sp. CG_9.8]MBG6106821.1 hypothetical protein [Frigoribacterium sp. CG_9.8]